MGFQEMMYVWNGFTIVGKRPELTYSILSTIQKAEDQLASSASQWILVKLFIEMLWVKQMNITIFKSSKSCLTFWLCPGQSDHHVDDQCVVQLLKGLCLRQLGSLDEAEGCFNHVISRWDPGGLITLLWSGTGLVMLQILVEHVENWLSPS